MKTRVYILRGLRLPRGMTRECCNELGRLISRNSDPEDDATTDELAVLIFEAVRRRLA